MQVEQNTSEKKSMLDHFADLEDPRTRHSLHTLQELLLVAICGVLSGADGWAAVSLWGRANIAWLQKFLPFANGVASHDTLGRVFSLLDASQFETLFINWMSGVCTSLEGVHLAVDGKTARSSKSPGGKALHMVSAFASQLGVTMGQVKTSDKSNEIAAIPELLRSLALKGCIVTIDAMGCQKAIAAQIVDQDADYILMVKNNQPKLAATLEGIFEEAKQKEWVGIPFTRAEWVEKDHGRIEIRRCLVIDDLSPWANSSLNWPKLKSVVMMESTREINGEISHDRRYYISSLNQAATHMGERVRGHWGVENGLHWSLDIAFGEDQARMREGYSAENFSILRRIALNLLRQDKNTKAGVKNRRLLAGWDEHYRQKILGIQDVS